MYYGEMIIRIGRARSHYMGGTRVTQWLLNEEASHTLLPNHVRDLVGHTTVVQYKVYNANLDQNHS